MTFYLKVRGEPRTKKNSPRFIRAGGRTMLIPSEAYLDYERDFIRQIPRGFVREPINCPVNLRCVYYMGTRRKVDLVNLLEATCDILVKAGVLEDDNARIVVGHDGSEVRLDREDPRVEIEIQEVEVC